MSIGSANSLAQGYYLTGIKYRNKGEIKEALLAFQEAWKHDPNLLESVYQVAGIHVQEARFEEALHSLKPLLEAQTIAPQTHLRIAEVHQKMGALKAAVFHFQEALKLDRNCSSAYLALGKLFFAQEQFEFAQDYFSLAINTDPMGAQNHYYQGLTQQAINQFRPAQTHFLKALEIDPQNDTFNHQMGLLLLEQHQLPQAFHFFGAAIKLNSDLDQEYNRMGEYFLKQRQYLKASGFFKLALRGPHFTKTLLYIKLAFCFEQESHIEAALYFYDKALGHQPDNFLYHYRRKMIYPALIYTHKQLAYYQEAVSRGLDMLNKMSVSTKFLEANLKYFELPYHALLHHPEPHKLNASLAQLWQSKPRRKGAKLKRKPSIRGEKRIGIVSSFLYNHSILRLFLPLFEALSHTDHVLFSFYLDPETQDEYTQKMAQISLLMPLDIDSPIGLAQKIKDHDLDMVIYPDLGQDSLSYFLASQKIAPTQVALPGHPISSGLKQVNYFVLSQALKQSAPQEHFSESCVYLSDLPIYYPRPKIEGCPDRSELGLPKGKIFLFPHGLYKWHPDLEKTVFSLLRAHPSHQVVFFKPRYTHWHHILEAHFHNQAPERVSQIHFLATQTYQDYLAIVKHSHLVLDSLMVGGSHTTYEALAMGTPVLTLEGKQLKQSFCGHLLRTVQLSACVTKDLVSYEAQALALAENETLYRQVCQTLEQESHRVFERTEGIQAMLDWINHH